MAQEIEIVLTEELKRTYDRLPAPIRKKFHKQVRFLARNPKYPSLKIHRLDGEWEFYIDVHYRCFFQRDGNKYILLTIGRHRIVDRYKIH